MPQIAQAICVEVSDAVLTTKPSGALTARTLPEGVDFMVPVPVFPHSGHMRATDIFDGPNMLEYGRLWGRLQPGWIRP
jgi:hypothetical protein